MHASGPPPGPNGNANAPNNSNPIALSLTPSSHAHTPSLPGGERPSSGAGGAPLNPLADLEPDQVPPELKKEGSDWWAIFSPNVPRVLDVSLSLTLTHERYARSAYCGNVFAEKSVFGT